MGRGESTESLFDLEPPVRVGLDHGFDADEGAPAVPEAGDADGELEGWEEDDRVEAAERLQLQLMLIEIVRDHKPKTLSELNALVPAGLEGTAFARLQLLNDGEFVLDSNRDLRLPMADKVPASVDPSAEASEIGWGNYRAPGTKHVWAISAKRAREKSGLSAGPWKLQKHRP